MSEGGGIQVLQGARPDTACLAPWGDVRLYSVQKALRRAGIDHEVFRTSYRASFPLKDLDLVLDTLEGWEVQVPEELVEGARQSNDELARHQRAREAVNGLSEAPSKNLLPDFPERAHLDPHQLVAVAAATHPDVHGLCLFDEQGLGKTVEALFSFHRLRQMGEVGTLLVLAPKNMVYEWLRDLERFFPGMYRGEALVGTKEEKRRGLDRSADVYVTNFETAVGLEYRLQLLMDSQGGSGLLVVDESFFVKNPGAERTAAVRRLRRHVDRAVVLCGTPAPNSPHDIVEQFNIADDGLTFGGAQIPEDRSLAREAVRHVLDERGVYLRRLKQEVLPELPERDFTRVIVPMEEEQRQLYQEALNGYVRDLEASDEESFRRNFTSFSARRAALLQICSNPSAVAAGYEGSPAKLSALDQILEELILRREEKVVVWSFYTKSLEAIYQRYQAYNPVRIDGSVTDTGERREAVTRFQEDDETMLFVGNPAASGAGITLHRARYAVYESMSQQAAHYLQSLDRIHRRGQERDVEYLFLLCEDSLEVLEYERLLEKEENAQELLGDPAYDRRTRETFLEEAEQAARLFKEGGHT